MNQKLGGINDPIGKMVALQCSVDDVETLREVLRFIPLAWKFKDAFQCMVCLGVVKPPVIFAICCKKLIACKDCMRHWILDTCPDTPAVRGVTGDNTELNQYDDMLSFYRDE